MFQAPKHHKTRYDKDVVARTRSLLTFRDQVQNPDLSMSMAQNIESRFLLQPDVAGQKFIDVEFEQGEIEEEDEQEEPFIKAKKSRTRLCYPPWRVYTGAFLLIVSLAAILSIYAVSIHRSHGNKKKQCGASPTEARQNGCRFEPMLSAWVPTDCSYVDVIDEYQVAYGDIHAIWPWYWDKNVTQRVLKDDFDILRAGNYSVIYTPYRPSHDLHCLYSWRKVSTALGRNHTTADARSAQFFHATHCAQHITHSLYNPASATNGTPEIWTFPLMYHDCVPLWGA